MTSQGGGRPELLAPVGEWDALVAAVQNGADAVYLGGKAYSARQFAKNFGPDELSRAVTYAHVRGVRVYVTVNTLIKETELAPAVEYVAELYELGVDAVIVQDLGLLRLLRRIFPALPVHASTQMTVHHPAGVRWLAAHGVKRVVLARELDLQEIRACAEAGLEIEVFVHGALCVCYSGQCLMSSLIGGRSGNRGRCAQPCRLEYGLVDREGRSLIDEEESGPHLLSTRELAALELLPELVRAGVAAFKVEGRMKRPEYVATVVRVYREALERLAAGVQEPASSERWRELAQAFNRGFTAGYLLGNPGRELMSLQRPSNRGVFLGRVSYYDRRRGLATLRLENPVTAGDGVEFWVSQGGRVGTTLARFWSAERRDGAARPLQAAGPGEKVVIPVGGAIQVGDRVFKTSDASLEARAATTFRSARETLQIPLRAVLTVRQGSPAELVLTDPEGLQGRAAGTVPASPAEKHALELAQVHAHLARLGNTPFRLAELELRSDPGTILPWSELNSLRRAALAELEEARAERHRPSLDEIRSSRQALAEVFRRPRHTAPARTAPRPARVRLATAISEVDAVPEVLAARPDRVILGGERFQPGGAPFLTAEQVAWAGQRCWEAGVELVLGFPRIIRRQEMAAALDLAASAASLPPEKRPAAFLVGNLGLLHRLTTDEQGVGRYGQVALHADWPLNLFNSSALALLAGQGIAEATLSPELTLEELSEVADRSPVGLEVLVHGPLELMVTEYCAPGALLGDRAPGQACRKPCRETETGLRDRLGLVFPLRLDASCRMHVANPKELCLIEHLPALAAAGLQVFRLDCRLREPHYAVQVTRAYREALSLSGAAGGKKEPDPAVRERLVALRRELERLAPQGITKGHYFRGVD
ncbi:MAG: DUF3656 domain-containing protein [Bacillota bacterium]|nr:DUF3656 domain-containing protein [Bacillota bacterium]